jgi:diguanylate cyclase (GGDEF)-like protein
MLKPEKRMKPEEKPDQLKTIDNKTFIPGLNRPGMWLFIYLFFAVLPLLIFLECYKIYVHNDFRISREKTIKYYYRELTAFRSKATNKRIFLPLFQNFRDTCRRNLPLNFEEMQPHFAEINADLPKGSSLIAWDASENVVAGLTRLAESQTLSNEKVNRLVKVLLNAYADFSSGKNLQTLHQAKLFANKNREYFSEIQPLIGRNFPVSEAFTSRNTVVGDYLDLADVFFYWDFFNNKDNSHGGFMVVIPRESLSPVFALKGVLQKDPSANPEFSNGLFDITTGEINLSYPGMLPVAKEMVSGYRKGVSNPYIKGDWVLFVQPIVESSSANIFSLFSIRTLRESYEAAITNSKIVVLILAVIIGFLFYYFFKVSLHQGLSLKKKLAWLFLFCMQLPISILIFLGIQFSLSKERLLSIEAETNLVQLVKKVDFSAQEYYRSLTEWLKSLKAMPDLKDLNKAKLGRQFFEFSKTNQLQSFYLIGIDGNIAFDIDNVKGETSNRTFIKELGIKILTNHSGSLEEDLNGDDMTGGGFMDKIIKRTGVLHQVVWPGSDVKRFVYTDVMQSNAGRSLALIAGLDKTEVDRNYLRTAITDQYKRNPDHEIFILLKEDISEAIPKLNPTFKANLLPLLSTVSISNSVETDRISDSRTSLLVALSKGTYASDFIIGARANWAKIVESIRKIYLLVILGLLFSLSASAILIMVLLREFLTPISILSSGAKAIIKGDLDLNLPVFAKDELGELSSTFNFMTRRLKNRLTELTVLYNMTQKASTSHNQREVFDLAAHKLLTHLKGEAQGTAWLNEGEGSESIYLAEHYSEEEDEAIRNVVLQAIRNFASKFEFVESINKHVLSIPLFFEDKKFGAIYLLFAPDRFDKDRAQFSEDEKSFIETLRHHLSLIIEKQRLFEQAITDGLTKLYVRRFFLATLEKELARSKRYQLDVSVVLLDIDHFKIFNDTHGHQAGDFVLRETSQRIVECIRAVDTPGRYGGEEMAVLLPQTNIKDAFVVADRIKKAIGAAEYNYHDKSMQVTVSIGVSALHGRQISVEELIEEADRALYVAKDRGRNQVRIAPEAM